MLQAPLELLIVFIGLLAALQVESWRERRSWAAAESRLLERLQGDLADSLVDLTTWLPKLARAIVSDRIRYPAFNGP